MTTSEPMGRLIAALARLPGVGRKSAERMAMHLARDPGGLARALLTALDDVRGAVRMCSRCGYVTTTTADPCALCTDGSRDDTRLCVVEDPGDITALERSGGYRGRYHSLMGKLSPMRGEGPGTMRVAELLARVRGEGVQEVILALNTDVDSDATAGYLMERLAESGVTVTRLAFGLPVGSGIGYSDPVTLARALEGRRGVA